MKTEVLGIPKDIGQDACNAPADSAPPLSGEPQGQRDLPAVLRPPEGDLDRRDHDMILLA